MRDESGQFIKGQSGNPHGRPKRADEAFLVDIWTTEGQKVFSKAVRMGKPWAIKLLMDKLYPNKKAVEAEVSMPQLPIPILSALRNEA